MTAEKSSMQRMFDTVYRHLLTQHVRSQDEHDKCMYRNPAGLKCALGCLIPDESYRPEFEGLRPTARLRRQIDEVQADEVQAKDRVSASHEMYDVIDSIYPGITPRLIVKLQKIHDYTPTARWRSELVDFAETHNLTVPSDV